MKVFADSSVLIEYIKGNKIEILEKLFNENQDIYINSIVASEFLYHYLGAMTNQSPRTLKEKGTIPEIISDINPTDFIEMFDFIESSSPSIMLAIEYMAKYNLFPNDAIILADCKINNIKYLASYDADFVHPCQIEKISLYK